MGNQTMRVGARGGWWHPVEEWIEPWCVQWCRGGWGVAASWGLVSSELEGLSRGWLVDPDSASSQEEADRVLCGLVRVVKVLGDDDAVMVVLARLVPGLLRVCSGLLDKMPDLLDMDDAPGVVFSTAWDEVRAYGRKDGVVRRVAANVVMNTAARCRWDHSRTRRKSPAQIGTFTFDASGERGDGRRGVRSEESVAGCGAPWGRSQGLSVEAEAEQSAVLEWLRSEVNMTVTSRHWAIDADTAFYLAAGAWVFGMTGGELAAATGLGSAGAVRARLTMMRKRIRARNPQGSVFTDVA